MYETIHKETVAGFDIVFSVAQEDTMPEGWCDDDDVMQDTIKRIENGSLEWFRARVQAFKNGIELGTDYLGGCCYPSYMDFVSSSDYYGDMVENVVSEARDNIAKLCK